jgi:hypothetical protein
MSLREMPPGARISTLLYIGPSGGWPRQIVALWLVASGGVALIISCGSCRARALARYEDDDLADAIISIHDIHLRSNLSNTVQTRILNAHSLNARPQPSPLRSRADPALPPL